MGAEYRVAVCDLGISADQAAEPVALIHRAGGPGSAQWPDGAGGGAPFR